MIRVVLLLLLVCLFLLLLLPSSAFVVGSSSSFADCHYYRKRTITTLLSSPLSSSSSFSNTTSTTRTTTATSITPYTTTYTTDTDTDTTTLGDTTMEIISPSWNIALQEGSVAPLFITIGPPCCGKTTRLKTLTISTTTTTTTTITTTVTGPTHDIQHYPFQQQQQQQQQPIVDIALDDQPDVYVPVPTHVLLSLHDSMTNPTTTNTTNTTTTTASTGQNEMSWEAHPPPPPIRNHSNNRNRTKEYVDDVDVDVDDLSNRYYHGKSLQTRWLDHENDELRYILQRWTGRLSPHKFAISMVQLYQRLQQQQQHPRRNDDNATARMIAQQVIQITERFLQHHLLPPPPPMINIFVVESLFRQHPKTQLSAIDYAYHQLRQTPLHIPVAWGNTNTKPRDYQIALDVAAEQSRPVYFILYHTDKANGNDHDHNHNHNHNHNHTIRRGTVDNTNPSEMTAPSSLTIPAVPFSTLYERNLQRWITTGKYIPAMTIYQSLDRVQKTLVQMPLSHTSVGPATEIEQRLVQLASPSRGPYQYQMTAHRTILKLDPSQWNLGPNRTTTKTNHHDHYH